MQCECLERLIDPQTKKVLAAYGWIIEKINPRYWVSIDGQPYEFFPREYTAKLYFDEQVKALRGRVLTRAIQPKRGNYNKPKAHAVVLGK
jgi:hypothetical protein